MKNLLLIVSRYPHPEDKFSGIFIYSQIEELKKYFKKIVVVSILPYIPLFIAKHMSSHRIMDSKSRNYSYDNVHVFYLKNFILPFEFSKRFLGYVGVMKTIKLLRDIQFKPDLIHAHFSWPSGYIAMRLKQEFNIPYIITGHGYDVYRDPFMGRFWFNTIKKTLNYANHIITVSHSNKTILISKLGIPGNHITVIPNGYHSNIFFPQDQSSMRKKLHISKNKIICLSIGNLYKIKGHEYLIRAANIIKEKDKTIVFYLIGDGPEKEKISSLIDRFHLQKYFLLLGSKSHKEIPLWINACNYLILPSLNEGFGIVLIEALACGKPCIATDVGGVSEIINNKKLGILIPSQNPDALANAILEAKEINWDIEYITRYSKKFFWKTCSKEILYVYQNVLKKKILFVEQREKRKFNGITKSRNSEKLFCFLLKF